MMKEAKVPSLFFIVAFLILVEGILFNEKKLGEITPINPLALVNEILELNCTVFEDSGLNNSMIFWEDYNETRVTEETVIPFGERTLLFKKNITGVEEEGMYACKSIDGRDISYSSLVIEYEAVRDVTNFNCILFKSRDEFICTWKLGLYHHPAYLKINASVSMDNKRLIPCPQNDKEKCTWTSDDGAINSVLKIVILQITNRRYGVSKTIRREYTTRDITKYDPPKSIQVMNQNSTDCTCANVQWEGISGGVDTSSRVTMYSKWETSDISVETDGNTSLTVCDLVPASTYVVQVQVKPKGGQYYSDMNKTSLITCSTAPSMAPSVNRSGYSSAKCYDLTTHRKVTVYWKKIPKRFQNGHFINYTISYGDNVHVIPDNSYGEIQIPCKSNSIVTVKGCNQEGCSPESNITIPQFGEVILPTSVIVEHVDASKVELSWFHTERQTAVDIIWCKGRSGTLQCLDEIDLLRINGSGTQTSLSASDVNSKIDDVYFGVALINDKQLSGGIKWQETCRYQRNKEPMKIMGVKVLPDAPENSLIISWSPVICDTSNINNVYVHSYEIIFCRLDAENQCIGDESSVELPATDNTQYTLRNLHSNVNYGVWVRARSLRKNGPRSDMVTGIPINNDLPTSAVAGLIVAGIFVFVLVMAGGVCILRNLRKKLGFDDTFPIHMPNVELKTGETNLNAPANGLKSPFTMSSESKEGCGFSQSAERASVLCSSNDTLIKILNGNPKNKSLHTNDTPLGLTDVPSEIGRSKGGDNERTLPTVANSKPTSPIINPKEKQIQKEEESKEILPPDYSKATTIALTCLHEIERSPNKEENGTNVSPLNSYDNTLETTFTVDDNIKENEISTNIWKEDYTEEISTSPQYITNDPSFNNDESYVTNDLRHWYNDRKLSDSNASNEIERCQKVLLSVPAVKQLVDPVECKEMPENLLNSIKTTILDNAYKNENTASSLDTKTPTMNQEDNFGSKMWSKDYVHTDATKTLDHCLTTNTAIDSVGAEMWDDYVPNDTQPVSESDTRDTFYVKQIPVYLPNDPTNKNNNEENGDHVG
ncbi:uncharacterized protein LOC133190227 [Saccostrea echinata]|uniref:uncharacterized protein LOC133190227 n=1 Tax=Saccostrea echinata TaxID=191078 RepID=UPI002A8372D8|nr:uncharacterized protein LOC133190227 [Saccostrea echinata]